GPRDIRPGGRRGGVGRSARRYGGGPGGRREDGRGRGEGRRGGERGRRRGEGGRGGHGCGGRSPVRPGRVRAQERAGRVERRGGRPVLGQQRGQLLVHLLRGGRPVARVLGEQPQHEGFERYGDLGAGA